ncbi:MAG: helix-turn-helix transcriptional regulator, partial [bacterium]|nr:helix-turn-helix transcriptional regulator [bacterium]
MTKESDGLAAIGRRFKRFRELFDFEIEDMAALTGKPESYFEEVEAGKRAPGIEELIYIQEILKVDLNWILTGDNDVIKWERYEVG